MYEGSMMGAGPVVFAVWGYVISKAVDGQVELNPRLLSVLIGTEEENVCAAIEYLCLADPNSRSKKNDGRRLVKVGQFAYEVTTHEDYRNMRSEEDRRQYNRERKREERAKKSIATVANVANVIDMSHNVANVANVAHTDTDTDTDTDTLPKAPQREGVGDEPKIPEKLNTPRFLNAFSRWREMIPLESKNGKPANTISLQSTLEKLASYSDLKATGYLLAWVQERRIFPNWKSDWETYAPKDVVDPYNDNRVYGPSKKATPKVNANGKR
jgi:hypothetical protein